MGFLYGICPWGKRTFAFVYKWSEKRRILKARNYLQILKRSEEWKLWTLCLQGAPINPGVLIKSCTLAVRPRPTCTHFTKWVLIEPLKVWKCPEHIRGVLSKMVALAICGYLNLNEFKLNSVQNSVSWFPWAHFKYLAVTCGWWPLYWTAQVVYIVVESFSEQNCTRHSINIYA